MDRPFVFCHMLVSLDGKIMGSYMDNPHCSEAFSHFDQITFGETGPYQASRGWLSGRVTTDDNFTLYRKPDVRLHEDPVPAGDYITGTGCDWYYVSIDPRGVLGWTENVISYGGREERVLEVLTEKAPNEYKALLRRLDIPYVICGEEQIDFAVLLEKLKNVFAIDMIMLGGGAVLNWSFIKQGLCDEVSLVIAPSADGSTHTQTLFMQKDGLSDDRAVSFNLVEVKALPGNTVWLRYKVVNP